jgi:hypothetical protein
MRGARSAAESFSTLRILPQREGFGGRARGGGDARERTREKKRIEEQTSRSFESIDVEKTMEAWHNN